MELTKFFHRLFTRRVMCLNCPHFRFVKLDKPTGIQMGVCELEKHVVTNFPRLALAFPVRYENEQCAAHPLFREETRVKGLRYVPGKKEYADTGGFSRAPSLAEAATIAGNRGQITFKSGPVVPDSNSADNSALDREG